VTFTSSDPAVALINGNQVTILAAGTTVITASQAGNANYNAANPVQRELVVSKRAQEITFASLEPKTTEDDPFTLSATASSGLAVNYVSSNPSVASISGNTVTIVGDGTTTITASQDGNDEYVAATPVSRELQVTLVTDVEAPVGAELRLYPNPVEGELICACKESESLRIFTALGTPVKHTQRRIADGLSIDMSMLAPGVYVIRIVVDGKHRSYRVVKQ